MSVKLPEMFDYQAIELIYQSDRTLVYRGIKADSGQPIAIKLMAAKYPSFNELVQFRNQYAIAKNLDIEGIVKPIALERYENRYALIVEDFGGISLADSIGNGQGQTGDLVDFFNIAIQLSEILHHLHQNRVIHKDIKPANILIHPQTKQVKLIDFSISSLLPKETQTLQTPNVLEGTLAYISPEQTGRMNRGIDYRSDFYSLGVTFYELLTGTLPFIREELVELIYAHIAQTPEPITHCISWGGYFCPPSLSNIVLKLMAKNAEDRYQSALGLKYDLEKCLAQYRETGQIELFELGKRDRSDRFTISEKLYGRETEVQTLLDAFDRVAEGSSELMLVVGFSGIGKTAAVNEVHKPIVRERGYFIKGKFDQFNRNIPFSAFVQAFQDLIGQLLGESDAALAQWKTKILNALGDNARVIVDVIPELEDIVGKQPPAPKLSGSAAQNRFELLWQKFIAVFTTPEHPLVLFLDDLQWADSASLHLIEVSISGEKSGYLLILGAYRDNEVSPSHPLMLMLEELKKSDRAAISTLVLQPLAQNHIDRLVAETLKCREEIAQPLSELIYQKTGGNPFFIRQLLQGLYDDSVVNFNYELEYWECNFSRLQEGAIANNVVDFVAERLQKLPETTREVLKRAACIGNHFDLNILAIVYNKSTEETASDLWQALKDGLLLPQDKTYKLYQNPDIQNYPSLPSDRDALPHYKFLHDRVQQAAYSLIPEAQKQQTHLTIGQLLLQNFDLAQQEEEIFAIVNQLNCGISLVTDPSQRHYYAGLNLKAGRKAKSSTAYTTALNYCDRGMQFLTETGWERDADLMQSLAEEAAESALLVGNFERMESLIEPILTRRNTLLDRIKAYELKLQGYQLQNQKLQAIEIGREILKPLGFSFPETVTPTEIQQQVENTLSSIPTQSIADLVNLPAMEDENAIAALRIIMNLVPSVHQIAPHLFPILACEQVRLSLQYGNSPFSAPGYADFGIVVGVVLNKLDESYQFGELALAIADRFAEKSVRSMVVFKVATFNHCNRHSIREAIDLLKEAYKIGLDTGDSVHTLASISFQLLYSYLSSAQTLPNLQEDLENYQGKFWNFRYFLAWIDIIRYSINNFMNWREDPDCLGEDARDEERLLFELNQDNEEFILHLFYLAKAILSYSFGDWSTAFENADRLPNYLKVCKGTPSAPIYYFYDSLICLALYPTVDPVQQECFRTRVAENQETLSLFADAAPMNYRHKYDLVEAVRSQRFGNKIEAIEAYDRAIAGAKENQHFQEEALANELAAQFYLDWGKEKVATAYMQDAYYGYAHWGALAKTEDLANRYPHLLQPILQSTAQSLNFWETIASISPTPLSIHSSTSVSRSSVTSINSTLDFATILKASQNISSTIDLDELIHHLTQTIVQHSGGDRCALILPDRSGEWQIEALVTPETEELGSQPLKGNPHLPVKLIQYVKRTQKAIVIDNLQTDLPVLDRYLHQQRPQSLLTLPIFNQGHLVGILYLENRTTRHVFTLDCIQILNLLCTQAAISLENAHLYQESRIYAQRLERSLEQLRIGENRFQKLADNIPGLIYQIRIEVDGSSSISYVSCGSQSLYEVSPEDLMSGKYSLRDFEHPEDSAEVFQAVIESAQNLSTFQHEWRIITPSGKVKWVKAASQPERLEDGSMVWDGIVIDITDRKEIESEQKLLLAILENTSDLVGTCDLEGKTLYLNRAWRNLLGLENEEFMKGLDIAQHHPDWAFQIVANEGIPEAIRLGSWMGETAVLDAEGREIPVSQVVLSHKSNSGEVEYFSTIIRDISAIKTAEQALRISEQNLRTIFDHANHAIFVHDMEGNLLDVNKRMLQMYGLESREEALSYLVLDYSAPDNPFDRVPALWASALAGETVRFEWKGLRPRDLFVFEGETILNKLTLGNKDVIIASVQDISDRKRAEVELQQKTQELEQTLQELRQTQLQIIQSEKMSSLGQMVAGVAHEINNPVSFIHGNLPHIEDYVRDLFYLLDLYERYHSTPHPKIQEELEAIDFLFLRDDLMKVLQSMRGGTNRIRDIVLSLRNFSRLDESEVKNVDLHQGIENTITILHNRLKAQGKRSEIQVTRDYSNLPLVECCAGQLNQVFMNVLTNAIDALEECDRDRTSAEIAANPSIISIQTRKIDERWIEICIADNGSGIPPSIQNRLFDPFFTTKPVGKGTGLGLSISYQIVVEKHRGKFWCESAPGTGTQFFIQIPLSPDRQLNLTLPEEEGEK